MESADTITIPLKKDARVLRVRRMFSLATILAVLALAVGIGALASSRVLGLRETSRAAFYSCMYMGAVGFFIAALSRLLLDIMCSIFGFLRLRILPLFGWIFLVVLSLIPLAAIFAASKLAAGLQG